MRVLIPSALQSYTRAAWVDAEGRTVTEVLTDLDRQYPGIRFRMVDERQRVRPHIRLFVNQVQVFDLGAVLVPDDRLHIVQALSGG